MASLIHSFIWPLSFPLLTGESLRGLPLEFLPCAFYPLLSRTLTRTLTHTHVYPPPHFRTPANDFMSMFVRRETDLGNDHDFRDKVHTTNIMWQISSDLASNQQEH